ncbi:MAG TPA: hypothetical protein VFM31_06775 [Nitrososphaeraceae archaeon]|nr:hypothetical protein [Nitrososphaeraceae archaeon]
MCKTGESAYVIVISSKMMMTCCMVSCVLIAYLAITSHYCDSSFAQIPDNSDNNMENVRNSILLNGSNKEVSNNTILLYQVKIGNSLYPVEISSSGRQVNNLLYDTDEKSLVLIMEPPDINNTSNNGTLDIEIPRVILNSQINKIDQNFTVTIDGHPTKFKETTKKIISSIKSNSTKDNTTSLENINQIGDNRKLAIEFAQDSKIIKITGMDINEPRNQVNQNNQSSMTGQSSTLNNEEQQNILIAIISASTGVIVAFIYTLYSKNKIKFKRSKKK